MIYAMSRERGMADYFYAKRSRHLSCVPHVHSHIEFVYVMEGTLGVSVDSDSCLLTQGMMAVIMPYQIHNFEEADHPEAFIIACPPEYIVEYRQLLNEKVFSPFFFNYSDMIYQLVSKISLISLTKEEALKQQDSFKYKALLYYTVAEFINTCKIVPRETFEFDVYRGAIFYISEHYTEDISLESVAGKLNVTASHLSRILNRNGNIGFSDIVNSLRITYAKRMLEQTNRSISEIAFSVGCGSIRNFNRIFQKHYGCSPRAVRGEKGIQH